MPIIMSTHEYRADSEPMFCKLGNPFGDSPMSHLISPQPLAHHNAVSQEKEGRCSW